MDEREITTSVDMKSIKSLCEEYKKYNYIPPELYERFDIKRGLRNQDGTGVIAGLTHICNVHGYVLNEGEKDPIDGQLIYRGININDIVENCVAEQRFGFEEVVYLLIFGTLPNQKQLERFSELMSESRELPQYFFDDMVLKAPSKNVMNKLARSVLALYSYEIGRAHV